MGGDIKNVPSLYPLGTLESLVVCTPNVSSMCQPEEEEDLEEDDNVRSASGHTHPNGNGVDGVDEVGDGVEYNMSNTGLLAPNSGRQVGQHHSTSE